MELHCAQHGWTSQGERFYRKSQMNLQQSCESPYLSKNNIGVPFGMTVSPGLEEKQYCLIAISN